MLGVAHDTVTGHAASVESAFEALGGSVHSGGIGQLDVPIGPMTTYRVGGNAAVFVKITSQSDLQRVARAVGVSGLPVFVLGRGSNVLVSDTGFSGIVVSMIDLADAVEIDSTTGVVCASAGVLLPVLARRTAAAGLTGFEWAVGVPGSIGGAVRMNAGGHGSDISASLIDIRLTDLRKPDLDAEVTVASSELGLRFRGSSLRADAVVVNARLQLARGDREAAEREISEIVGWRRANQPGGQNAGSVFVNPVPGEVSAGELIDAAGMRGLRVGTACVSEKHANFIQADESGSAADVRALMRIVQKRVAEASGYEMRSEIRLLGFED